MKPRLFMVTGLALLACTLIACAPRQGRTLDEYPPVKIPTVQYPDEPFDTQAARAALQPGTATLTGKFCIVGNDGIEDSRNVEIYLYPATPHLQAWHKLRASQPEGAPVSMVPEALAVHRVTRTDGNGIFQFTGLQPGRYFVQATIWCTAQPLERVRGHRPEQHQLRAGDHPLLHRAQFDLFVLGHAG